VIYVVNLEVLALRQPRIMPDLDVFTIGLAAVGRFRKKRGRM
jgi:hypothetical protein